MANSPYLRDLILDRVLLDSALFPELWMSLHTEDPRGDGRNEMKAERQLVRLVKSQVGAAVNADDMEFLGLPVGVVTHYGIWSERTGGQFLTSGKWLQAQTVLEGQGIRIRTNDIVIRYTE